MTPNQQSRADANDTGTCDSCALWQRQDAPATVGKCSGRIMNGLTNEKQSCSEHITEAETEAEDTVRPEVSAFATEMEQVLRENDYKIGWDKMSVHALFSRIKQEFEEMFEQYILYCNSLDGRKAIRVQEMQKEAIDIANFCMFLCHNYPKKDLE